MDDIAKLSAQLDEVTENEDYEQVLQYSNVSQPLPSALLSLSRRDSLTVKYIYIYIVFRQPSCLRT